METLQSGKFLTTREVAKLLHVNDKMVYTLVNDKGLPATKVTGKWLFPKRLVEEWIETHIINYRRSDWAGPGDPGILLLAGSDDPLFQHTLFLYHDREPDVVPFFANLGSMGGLKSLRRGICHIGVCHLLQDDNQEYNFDFADRELDKAPVFVNFSRRRQGLLVGPGNPKGIMGVADLAREDVCIVNRPLGTGTRLLLDYEIARSAIASAQICGYHHQVSATSMPGWRFLPAVPMPPRQSRRSPVCLALAFFPCAGKGLTCSSTGSGFLNRVFRVLSACSTSRPFRIWRRVLRAMMCRSAARCFFQIILLKRSCKCLRKPSVVLGLAPC